MFQDSSIYYEKIYEKVVRIFFTVVQNVKYVLDICFRPNSIKIENWTVSKVTEKEKPLNLNHAERSEVKWSEVKWSEVKSLACPVSLC